MNLLTASGFVIAHESCGDGAPRPFGNSYWLWTGRVLAGEHPGLWGVETLPERLVALAEAGIPAAPLATVRQAWTSDHAFARGLVSSVTHPTLGPLHLPEQPVQFVGSPRGQRRPAPGLDEHGAEIRAELEG